MQLIHKDLIILLLFSQYYLIENQNPSKNIITDCDRCRILSESFRYWFDKTARGKYEGGDAAWEEKKLKSYARSEIRLVEIQEGLCSELKKYKDDCYALNEKSEQSLEKWWLNKVTKGSDLFNWLCIEELMYCCPKHSYGPTCEPCPRDINDIVCGGKGKCNGDGLREGSGTCDCQQGYIGKLCDDCSDNYYKGDDDSCVLCHEACNNCTGPGSMLCIKCKSGWRLNDDDNCVDVNECFQDNNCQIGEYCENKLGSYLCKKCDESCLTCAGVGVSNCTSCKTGEVLWSGICIDQTLKENLTKDTVLKILLYTGLCSILFFIFKHSGILASFVTIAIGIYIYVLESKMVISSFNVLLHLANFK